MTSRLCLFAALLAVGAGCDSLRLDDATFFGTVLDAATSAPVAGATVSVGGVTTVTDATGAYELVVEVDDDDQPFTVTVTAPGYQTLSLSTGASPGDDVAVPPARLARSGTGGAGNPGLPTGPSGASGPATSVTLADRSSEVVGVTGAGGVETATLEFIAVDAQGRSVDLDNAVDLTFEIASGPGGGEALSPSTAQTGSDGRARVTLTSGTRAGTVQVVARGQADGVALESLPVTVTITGGLPDEAHFSIAPNQLNFAGYNRFGLTNPVTAFVGDKYGNPVQPGTAVYFTTDGGIVPGSGVTDPAGTTTVNLLSAAPQPSNPSACSPNPQGYARVTASTSGEGGAEIDDSATVLFSGVTDIGLSPGGLRIGPYDYTVADQFGHPLAPGTSITVTADGVNIKATGDVNVTLGDFLCPGPGRTTFRFGIAKDDPSADADAPVLETITIEVQSPNGNFRLTRSDAGRVGAAVDQVEEWTSAAGRAVATPPGRGGR